MIRAQKSHPTAPREAIPCGRAQSTASRMPQRTALALAVSALVALPPTSQASGFNALPSGDWFDPIN